MLFAFLRLLAAVGLPSAGAAAFCYLGFRLSGSIHAETWVVLTGLITLAVYLFHYCWPLPHGQSFPISWRRFMLGVVLLLLAVAVFTLIPFQQAWKMYLLSAVLPLAYTGPKIPKMAAVIPLKFLYHKPIVLAAAWVWGAFLLPWICAGGLFEAISWLILTPHIVNLLGLCLLFSWRDRKEDPQAAWLKRVFRHPRQLMTGLALLQLFLLLQAPVFLSTAFLHSVLLVSIGYFIRKDYRWSYVLADASMLLWWF